jgi:hypothetical protein
MKKGKIVTRWIRPEMKANRPLPKCFDPHRNSMRTLEGCDDSFIVRRLESRWPGLGPITGTTKLSLFTPLLSQLNPNRTPANPSQTKESRHLLVWQIPPSDA